MKRRVARIARPLHDLGRLDQAWPIDLHVSFALPAHSQALRRAIGLPPNFSVFDSADQIKLIKDAIKALDVPTYNFPPGDVHGTISNAKNHLHRRREYAQHPRDFYSPVVARVYHEISAASDAEQCAGFRRSAAANGQAIQSTRPSSPNLQERFQYILIDEYQDTNHAQYVLAHALAPEASNICVVGDPDQSIYAWRGADMTTSSISSRIIPMPRSSGSKQNYRSTKPILAIAPELIANNPQRKEKRLWTENDAGEKARSLLPRRAR